MGDNMSKKKWDHKISSWTIQIRWDNGVMEDISDMPDNVAKVVDDWLTELENQDV